MIKYWTVVHKGLKILVAGAKNKKAVIFTILRHGIVADRSTKITLNKSIDSDVRGKSFDSFVIDELISY